MHGTFVSVKPDKLQDLRELLRSFGRCLVAYSGGVDSTFLAYMAWKVLGDNSLAVIADTPSLPRRELAEAIDIAHRFGFPVRVVKTHEFDKPEYVSNSVDRCYHCKRELFSVLGEIARTERFNAILYGENADDTSDFRPGTRAAAQCAVRAPLKEVGLTKAEVRELSAEFGLPTADKPAMACLSSRVPYGEPVTPQKLVMIESAETALRELGFRQVRVRHHELKSQVQNPKLETVLTLARIEIDKAEMQKFLDTTVFAQVTQAFKRIGYNYVTLDLEGYRTGSLNEPLVKGNRTISNSGDA